MTLPQALHDFFQQQKARYDELFWYEVREQKDGGIKLILMIEKLAEKARAAFDAAREVLIKEDIKDIEIVSFELDDSIGEFYMVEAEQIDVETRPSKQEYQSIMDKDLNSAFTDQTNDVYQDQLVKVFQPRRNMVGAPTESSEPKGYSAFCVVVFHSFGRKAPSQIGWIRNLEGLKRVGKKEFVGPEKPISFEEACGKLEGVKYQIGGGSMKNGFDCSSLVQKVFYETKGIWLPRKARWQQVVCELVELKDLKQGDLVFFSKAGKDNDGIDHVALVFEAQSGKLPKIFHAKRINGKAMFEDLNQAKWLKRENNFDGAWEISGFGRVKS